MGYDDHLSPGKSSLWDRLIVTDEHYADRSQVCNCYVSLISLLAYDIHILIAFDRSPTIMWVGQKEFVFLLYWIYVRLVCIMVNRLTLELRAFFIQENATSMQRTEPSSGTTPFGKKRSRVTLKFRSPSRTALSTTFSGMDSDFVDSRDPKLQTISETSNASHSIGAVSSDVEEFELQKLKEGEYSLETPVWKGAGQTCTCCRCVIHDTRRMDIT